MMTKPYFIRSSAFLFTLLLSLISSVVFSQTTFTVVCDKTDNKVKVVEASKRSPDYVPIKGGFPFRQVAQQWITDNYPSGTCDPEKVKKENQSPAPPAPPAAPQNAPGKTPQAVPPGTPPAAMPTPSVATAPDDFRNNSLLFQLKVAGLGGAFNLGKSMVPGLGLGYDRLFGRKFYFGTGLNAGFFFTDFAGLYGYESQTFVLPRIPLYLGYRKMGPKFMVMAEAGIHANATLLALDSSWEMPGKTMSDHSFDLLARMRIGNSRMMLEFGTEYWLTGLFDEDDFRMSSTFIGGRFFF